jgi:hypothetical protein
MALDVMFGIACLIVSGSAGLALWQSERLRQRALRQANQAVAARRCPREEAA